MTTLKRWLPFLIGSSLVALLLVAILMAPAFAQGPGGMMGGYGYNGAQSDNYPQSGGYGPGWMHRGYGPGMMGGFGPGRFQNEETEGYGPGWMHGGFGSGWAQGGEAEGYGYGCAGGGRMWSSNSPFFAVEPLTLVEATEAVQNFLTNLNDANLELGEVMIFDNHAYAQIVEKDTDIGAMEVLVDAETGVVYPEMGPNMMWNLKYGMMSGSGHHGVMHFGYNTLRNTAEIPAEMPVTPAEAVEAAQAYLDNLNRNFTADAHADPFYGYYTLHVNYDGEVVGMLSVNGYTKQVFLHTWHGTLLEMSEHVEEHQ